MSSTRCADTEPVCRLQKWKSEVYLHFRDRHVFLFEVPQLDRLKFDVSVVGHRRVEATTKINILI